MNELEKYIYEKDPKGLGLTWVVDEREIRKLAEAIEDEEYMYWNNGGVGL